ncbi:MAG: HD domain-containing protein [Spirochaetaceae bacterium]|nr:HD domain-containing protein [Spirochaetaceae bacterium]
MAFTITGFLLLAAGGVIMVIAAAEYSRLVEYYKQEIYESLDPRFSIIRILLYLFIFGFAAGAVNCILRKVDLFFVFAALVYFLGAGFIFFTLRIQAGAAVMLREKTLEAIRAFVKTIDLKEFYTKNHSREVYDIVCLFFDQLVDYRHVLNRAKLLDAAILHDIGKINISAELLSKRDELSPEEWEIIKSHPRRGKEMLEETWFREIGDWVKYHHERVDGNGYYGLVSEMIPLESKIIAIADTYAALCSDRAYRSRVSHEEAIEVITREAGKHFDRKLVECFRRIDRNALDRRETPQAAGKGFFFKKRVKIP